MILYRACQRLVLLTWPRLGGLTVEGAENIPPTGPFLLVSNHQSILDPILIQSVCPRVLHTMSKSTQFSGPLMSRLMPAIYAFPVRRYEIDAQAVRVALRHLAQGHPVGVYLEGERSWDGRLQPPRLGTVRLILKAGVPVVPASISGSYDAWPRWANAFRFAPVRIRFGPPLSFPKLDRRADREAALASAAATLMTALRAGLAPASPDRAEPAPGAVR